eukprot:3283981-Rhodomonas_salina.2
MPVARERLAQTVTAPVQGQALGPGFVPVGTGKMIMIRPGAAVLAWWVRRRGPRRSHSEDRRQMGVRRGGGTTKSVVTGGGQAEGGQRVTRNPLVLFAWG